MPSSYPSKGDGSSYTDVLSLVFDQNIENPRVFPSLTVDSQLKSSTIACNCKKAIRRFGQDQKVISDGPFELRIICKSIASVLAALELRRKYFQASEGEATKLPQIERLCLNLAASCECSETDISETASVSAAPLVVRVLRPFDLRYNDAVASILGENVLQRWVNKDLVKKIREPLGKSKIAGVHRPGYVYILSNPSMRKYLKIGVSKDHPEVRRHRLAKCYEDISLVAYTSMIPHAHRVERLVHAELAKQRCVDECARCRSNHGEWFKVSRELAIQVVLRWAAWLATQPYREHNGALDPVWHARLIGRDVFSLKPAANHLVSSKRTWQVWTDQRRPTGRRDYSGKVVVKVCDEEKSPFL